MIARSFAARAASGAAAAAYCAFFRETLVPQLTGIPGHRGALVVTRPDRGEVAITVFTFWDSMEAIARFAGDTPGRAVVEPEARAILSWFDGEVVHQEVSLAAFAAPLRV